MMEQAQEVLQAAESQKQAHLGLHTDANAVALCTLLRGFPPHFQAH